MLKKLIRFFVAGRPLNSCHACMPRTHDEMLLQHRENTRRIKQQINRHLERFVP